MDNTVIFKKTYYEKIFYDLKPKEFLLRYGLFMENNHELWKKKLMLDFGILPKTKNYKFEYLLAERKYRTLPVGLIYSDNRKETEWADNMKKQLSDNMIYDVTKLNTNKYRKWYIKGKFINILVYTNDENDAKEKYQMILNSFVGHTQSNIPQSLVYINSKTVFVNCCLFIWGISDTVDICIDYKNKKLLEGVFFPKNEYSKLFNILKKDPSEPGSKKKFLEKNDIKNFILTDLESIYNNIKYEDTTAIYC